MDIGMLVYAQFDERVSTHKHAEGLDFYFFTHIIVLSALPMFVQSNPNTDTISFYLNYISHFFFYQQELSYFPSLHF